MSRRGRSPSDPRTELVKRVIALPGDTVKALDGRRIKMCARSLCARLTRPSPDGQCWVEGDEPFHSTDSNAFGPVRDHRASLIRAGATEPDYLANRLSCLAA